MPRTGGTTRIAPGARRRPAGRPGAPSRAVFVRRRITALLVVALLVAGVVWGVGRLFGVLGDAWAEAVAEQAEPTDASTAQPVACRPDGLEWATDLDGAGAGGRVDIAVTVSNATAETCLVDAGPRELVATVVSGEDRIWSSADCGAADPVRLLLGPGDTTTRTVTWDGTRSTPGCAAVDAGVLPGTYQLAISYGGGDVAATAFALR